MNGIPWSGRNVTKLPIIGKIVTKPLKFGDQVLKGAEYEVVEITDDGEIYITNQWYKSGVPQIIHKNLVQSFEPVNENKKETMRAKFVNESANKQEEINDLKQKIMYARNYHPEKVDIYLERLRELEGELPKNTIEETATKPKKKRTPKWTADDKDTRVRSFSGGYEKSSWRGPNPTNESFDDDHVNSDLEEGFSESDFEGYVYLNEGFIKENMKRYGFTEANITSIRNPYDFANVLGCDSRAVHDIELRYWTRVLKELLFEKSEEF